MGGVRQAPMLRAVGVAWILVLLTTLHQTLAQDCTATSLCANNLCCSQFNYCGDSGDYCGNGCLSGPCWSSGGGSGSGSGSGVGSIITQSLYNQFFLHTNDGGCPAAGFYTYNAFITAAAAFPAFGTTGDDTTQKREIAAFFGQVSHETTGGWSTAPDGPYAWGLCYKVEQNCPANGYCDASQWPCASGKSYCGRGPIQISWNYNYGPAGQAIGFDGINNPELVETDSVISWKTALWFWMTPQSPKPSAHAVMVGQWTPTSSDIAANRQPGYGVVTNIVNGGVECGHGSDSRQQDRIGFFERYCSILGVSPGNNEDCGNQTPF